jgi:superoxide reductase
MVNEKREQIFKCEICGNIVELLEVGGGQLVCCGKPMVLMPEKHSEEGKEKHLPVIEKNAGGIIVKVGSIPHPMTKEHFIKWIEIITEKGISRKYLGPEDKPEVKFPVRTDSKNISARIYCNIHGSWRG